MEFEIEIIKFLQSGRTPFFDLAFTLISAIGSTIGVIGLCVLFLRYNRKLCFWYLFSYGFVNIIVRIIKETVKRIRPYDISNEVISIGDAVQDYSFPSGHVACATAIAIFLGCFLFEIYKSRSAHIWITVGCTLYVLLVAISRMYLGKHYLTDVLAAAAISAVICAAGLTLRHFVKKERGKENANKNGNQ